MFIYFTSFTTKGLVFFFDSAKRLTGGSFSASGIKGSLVGGFYADRLNWDGKGLSLVIHRFFCRPDFGEFFQGVLTLSHLDAQKVDIKLKQEKTSVGKERFSVKVPSLPIGIDIKSLSIGILMLRASNGEIYEAKGLELAARFIGRTIDVKGLNLFLTRYQTGIRFKGRAKGENGNTKMELACSIKRFWSQRKKLLINIKAKGDLDLVEIEGNSTGIAEAGLKGVFRHLLDADPIDWQANLQIKRLDPSKFNASIPKGNLCATVNMSGVSGNFKARAKGGFASKKFTIRAFDLAARFEDKAVFIEKGRIDTLGGTIDLFGQLLPDSRFEASARLKDIDLGKVLGNIHGNINGFVHGQGSLRTDEGLMAQVTFKDFTGELNSRPIRLSGDVFLKGQRLEVKDLFLASAKSKIFVTGFADKKAQDLDLTFVSPDLSDIYPSALGKLSFKAGISGTRQAPQVHAQLDGSRLLVGDVSVEDLRIAFDSKDIFSSDLNAGLLASGLRLGPVRFENVRGKLRGLMEKHLIKLRAWGEEIDAALNMQGSLKRNLSYLGVVESLYIKPNGKSSFKLSRPAKFAIRKETAFLSTLCLVEPAQKAKLCTRYQKDREYESIYLHGKNLPLSPISALAAFNVGVSGHLDLQVDLRGVKGGVQGTAYVGTQDARFFPKGKKQGYPFTLSAQAQISQHGISGKLNGQILKKVSLFGDFSLPQRGPDSAGLGKNPLKIDMKLMADDLSLLHDMVPGLFVYNGRALAQFMVTGTLDSPLFYGKARFLDIKMEYPEYGIKILSKESVINVERDRLCLRGELDSPKGVLRIKGSGKIAPPQVSMSIDIKGKEYHTVSLPHLQLITSPDLKVELKNGKLCISGTLDVPSASIEQVEIPESAILPSSDIKVIGEGAARKSKTAIDTRIDLDLLLGDDVKVNAYGLKGRIAGRLKLFSESDGRLTAKGILFIREGRYRALDVDLEIKKGRLNYFLDPIDNPGIEVEAVRRVEEDLLVGFRISGTLKRPVVELFSDPPLPESEIVRYLLGGKKGRGVARTDIIAGGANLIISRLRQKLGLLDELQVETGQASDDISLVVGTYLRPDLYLKFINDFDDKVTRLILRYDYSRHIEIETETGESPSAEIFFKIER